MDDRKDTAIEALLEHLIAHGPNEIAGVFARAFELAVELERERFLRAGRYQRTPDRHGYANGDTPFYPQSPERGRARSGP